MMFIDWLTEITGCPVCLATRSAVRWRVPISSDKMLGSGMRCTAARWIWLPAPSKMMAPSILASSRSRVAENSMSSVKPPLQSASTVFVVAQHHQAAGAPAQNPLEAVPHGRTRRDGRERIEQQRVSVANGCLVDCRHARSPR